ncbi:HAD family hydrolase [Muribaculaceae bacterium Isolate-013 (NCI)]|nr:HAD family hydrolase [Muribaculaceae bacterium Isolate-013 (NCI)]
MTVFDLDDTLFKERDFVTSSFRVIAREADRRGIISYEKALAILCAGRDGGMAFSSLAEEVAARAPGCGLTEEWMVNTYRTHTPDIKLDDATESVLAALRERGETLGLITDGRSNTQRAKIKALGLERFIEPRNILVSGETGFDKTHREPFDMIMMRNPAERRYVYVGDNSAKDFIWPNKLGWLTVQLDDADGVNIHPQSSDRPAAFLPQRHIGSLSQLL